ncbi:hypothetical protein [Virgibacillus sp. JSM 102003]|uniref:hypothetical protein n=1 Tax=Virgibacillus sp. JSM 102003 TaxID=1562108 RepID=UPI0035C25511
MRLGYRGVLLLLGTGTICVWGIAIFMFFTAQNSPVIANEHAASRSVIIKKSALFTQPERKADKVYAMKKKQQSPTTKLGSVRLTNEDNRVSIDVLLEMLEEK